LPPSVQEALGELVNADKDGLLALSVGVGLGVLAEIRPEWPDRLLDLERRLELHLDGVRQELHVGWLGEPWREIPGLVLPIVPNRDIRESANTAGLLAATSLEGAVKSVMRRE
jgi:hypothetical protein